MKRFCANYLRHILLYAVENTDNNYFVKKKKKIDAYKWEWAMGIVTPHVGGQM